MKSLPRRKQILSYLSQGWSKEGNKCECKLHKNPAYDAEGGDRAQIPRNAMKIDHRPFQGYCSNVDGVANETKFTKT